MNLHLACFDFQKKNLFWPITNIIIMFIYYPLEIVVFAYLFGKVFSKIGDIKKHFTSICYLFGLIFIAYIIVESLTLVKERIDAKYYPKMEHSIRLQLVDLIFNKMSINYESINNGEFVGRLLKIPSFVSFFYERFNRWAVPFLITIFGVVLFFFIMSFRMGLISLVTFTTYLTIFFLVCKTDIEKSRKRESKENKLLEDIDDTLHNCFSVITAGKIKDEKARLDEIHSVFDDSLHKQMASGTNIRWVTGMLNVISFSVLAATTLYLYKNNYISNSLTITFIVVLIFMVKHLRFTGPRVCEIFMFYGTLTENNEFIKSLIKDTVLDGYLDRFPIKGDIEFRNVTFQYPGSPQLALNNVSFKVEKGEKVAIIGKSASGKTSIIKLLLGFYLPTKGNIFIGDKEIRKINREYLRNRISIVHQNVKLFNRTVLENIAYGTKYTPEEIEPKLANLKVMKVFETLPNGLQTNAGKYGDNLSGGQKQVVYMLRCYFRENPIIILDEPTSAIDQFHKIYVLEMIDQLSKNATVIIVSHDPTIYNGDMFPKKYKIDNGVLKPMT